MPQEKKTFYLFLGLHSLLIGVFPFYVPVYLWQNGFDLGQISVLVAVTGVGFLAGLWCWDRLRHKISLYHLFLLVALLLLVLLSMVWVLAQSVASALGLALAYGLYNSFFWTTQRALFIEVMDPSRAGQAYGNFQLFVFAALQLGILIGGWLLQSNGFAWLVIFCVCIAVVGSLMLAMLNPVYPASMQCTQSVSVKEIFTFKDDNHSRTMFILDGGFLFLESFFWVISLFLLAHESFTQLGLMVIMLAVIFGGLFFVLKESIDRLDKRQMFLLAVAFYTMSWLLRAAVNDELPLLVLFVLLVLITFATSFFRLALNKRFYDLARESGGHRYLILKSFYSQLAVVASFLAVALLSTLISEPAAMLKATYIVAVIVAPVFAVYGIKRYRYN